MNPALPGTSAASATSSGSALNGAARGFADASQVAMASGLDPTRIPRHVAIIMDGNRRWAKSQGLMAIRGHAVGARTTRDIIQACADLGVKALTLYTFSTENWKRPRSEVAALLRLITRNLKSELPDMKVQGIQVRHIGRREGLPDHLLTQLDESISTTRSNSRMVLMLALNYGGRAELTDAVRALATQVREGRLQPEEITESHITNALYTQETPEPDLMIRTGGEMRTSNFLPWQLAYTELWVTPTLWPDFRPDELRRAIADFQHRERRFGGVNE